MSKIQTIINFCIQSLESAGIIGGFFIVFLESIIPIMPLGVFIGFNVSAFGSLTGFIVSYVATITGCMASFTLFRYVFRNLFYKIFRGKMLAKVEKFMQKISKIDFNALVILIAMPFVPAFPINIAAGLSNISWKKYLVAMCISKAAIVYFWGYVGSSIIEGFTDITVLLKMLALILGAYILSKVIEKVIKVEEK